MTTHRFAKIVACTGLALLPIFSPALTVPGLLMGLPKATAAALVVACVLTLSGRASESPSRKEEPSMTQQQRLCRATMRDAREAAEVDRGFAWRRLLLGYSIIQVPTRPRRREHHPEVEASGQIAIGAD